MAIGCGDSLVVELAIEPTIAPLTAALRTRLGIDERYYGQSGLYNTLAPSTLAIARVDIINGVASIYLTVNSKSAASVANRSCAPRSRRQPCNITPSTRCRSMSTVSPWPFSSDVRKTLGTPASCRPAPSDSARTS